jgi:prepilin-type N-terminal cleavage/methylation domain-containing protein
MLIDRLRTLLADESGFTLPELLTSMAILLTIMAGFTTLLVSTSRAELDMNNRFAARTEGQLALTRLRREVHCAISGVTAAGPPGTQRATLTLDTACPTAAAGAVVTWCTVQNGTGRYGLWRYVGAACSGTGVKVADYLTSPSPFTYVAQNTTSLAKLSVSFDVNLTPTKAERRFRLQDDLVLRNSTRA